MGYERVNSLINFINAASVLYRDDLKQNILYSHASMTAAYENDGEFGIVGLEFVAQQPMRLFQSRINSGSPASQGNVII